MELSPSEVELVRKLCMAIFQSEAVKDYPSAEAVVNLKLRCDVELATATQEAEQD